MGFEPILSESQSEVLTANTKVTPKKTGRGTENRTRIYWLKASYSSRWVIPPNWWWQLDLNQRPIAYEAIALPLCYVTVWQGIQESNLCQRSQSPLCYHYTNPHHKKIWMQIVKELFCWVTINSIQSITQSERLSTTIFIDVVFIQHKEKPPRVFSL